MMKLKVPQLARISEFGRKVDLLTTFVRVGWNACGFVHTNERHMMVLGSVWVAEKNNRSKGGAG